MYDLILWGGLLGGGYLWLRWYLSIWQNQLGKFRTSLLPILAQCLPPLCGVVILAILIRFSASDVRTSTYYLMVYLALGIAWLALVKWLFSFLGISFEFDVVERSNPAALAALSGALLGTTFCYAGGNIGEGPGTEVVIFSAGLATIYFFLVWWALSVLTEVDYTVTIDRDLAAGLRLGGFLFSAGLILGRAAAGNWVSYSATFNDMLRYGSPVLILLAFAVLVELVARPTPEHPAPSPVLFGALPLVAYVGGAAFYLLVGNLPV
jgi:uncharacterized membrane protein YjfL (UPF0719 family)